MYAMKPAFMANLTEASEARMPDLVLVEKTFTLSQLREYNRNRKADIKATAAALRFMGLE